MGVNEIIALRKEIEKSINEPSINEEIDNEEVNIGDFVEIKSLLVSGEVIKISNDQISVKLRNEKILKE